MLRLSLPLFLMALAACSDSSGATSPEPDLGSAGSKSGSSGQSGAAGSAAGAGQPGGAAGASAAGGGAGGEAGAAGSGGTDGGAAGSAGGTAGGSAAGGSAGSGGAGAGGDSMSGGSGGSGGFGGSGGAGSSGGFGGSGGDGGAAGGAGAGGGSAGSAGAAGAGGAQQGGAAGKGGSGAGPLGCQASYDKRNLAEMHGLNTKWRTYSDRLMVNTGYLSPNTPGNSDTRVTVQPDLGGLSAAAWAKLVSGVGTPGKAVNRFMLNLDPSTLYAANSSISDADWESYQKATLKDRLELTPAEEALIKSLQPKIDKNNFSVNQRDRLLLAFLVALETGPGGVCSGQPVLERRVPFILHQRKYVKAQPSVDHEDEDEFADDMSDFINRVRNHDDKNGTHVQRWIAGVRLGENMSPDPQQWKASVLYMVQRINAKTGGFLKQREVIANGPRMGSDYRIKSGNKVVSIDDNLAKDDFIPSMAKETDSFGVGYKFMTPNESMATSLKKMTCPDGQPCQPSEAADWGYFLEEKGFGALAKFANHFYPSYPRHANVVWVGDSGDAMATMSDGFVPEADYQAIAAKFAAAPSPASNPNFRGALFMESNSSELDFEEHESPHDIGKYMVYMNGSGTWFKDASGSWSSDKKLPADWVPSADHSFELQPQTIKMWSSWPALP